MSRLLLHSPQDNRGRKKNQTNPNQPTNQPNKLQTPRSLFSPSSPPQHPTNLSFPHPHPSPLTNNPSPPHPIAPRSIFRRRPLTSRLAVVPQNNPNFNQPSINQSINQSSSSSSSSPATLLSSPNPRTSYVFPITFHAANWEGKVAIALP